MRLIFLLGFDPGAFLGATQQKALTKKIAQQNSVSNNLPKQKNVAVILYPKDHWTLKTGYFEDHTPAIQVQTLPLEGSRSLG